MTSLQLNKFKPILSIYILFFVTACGGGSSSSSPEIKAPTVTFSASPTSLYVNETTTLSWSSTNSTSCSGSGGWSGAKAINGNENVIISISGDTSFSITCSGVGGSTSSTETVKASAKDLNISIAKWKDNKPSAISFDWDDSSYSHCSQLVGIFNNFNFKTTFGIITNNLDSRINDLEICYKAIAFDGHEIASHSASHTVRFNDLNATQEDKIYELEQSSDYIQDVFRHKPTLFIHPGNGYDPSNIMYKDYYLFSRIHNDFDDDEDFIANIVTETDYPRLEYILSLSIQESNWIKIAGHSVDGSGYAPINSQDLIKFLGDLEESNIWVDTHSSIALYQLIRNSVTASTANSEIIFNLSESEVDNKLQEFGIEFLPITVLIDSSEPIDIEGYLTCNDIPIGGEPLQFNYNIMLNMNIPYKEC